MSDNHTYPTYSAADIRRYHNGGMTAAEMYALEKQALEDPFLADAIEGYAGITLEAAEADMALLKNRMAQTTAKVIPLNTGKTARPLRWWKPAAAAAVAALLVFGGIKLANQGNSGNSGEPVAAKVKPNQEPAAPAGAVADTQTSVTETAAAGKVFRDTERKTLFASVDSIQQPSYAYTPAKPEKVNTVQEGFHYQNGEADSKYKVGAVSTDSLDASLFKSTAAAPAKLPVTEELKKRLDDDAVVAREKQAPAAPANNDYITTQPAAATRSRELRLNTDNNRAATNNGVLSNQGNTNFGFNAEQGNQRRAVNNNEKDLALGNNQAAKFNFNYRITDASGNIIPFANISIPAENQGYYSSSDGRFRLVSLDSVLNITVKAAGYAQQNFLLRNNAAWANLSLKETTPAPGDVVVVGDQKNYALKKKSGKIANKVDEAEPADGWENYDAYLANNINIRDKPKGEVELSFRLNKNGEPVDIKVDKSLGSSADEEAIRLITNGPKWKGRKKKARAKVVVTF